MNAFLEQMEEKINDFGLQLKEQLSQMSTLSNAQQLLQLEQSIENTCICASGELFGFALKKLLENPDVRRVSIDKLHTHGRPWKSKGLRSVRIRLTSGAFIEVKTPYFVPDSRGKKGPKRKKRRKKGSGCYPVLRAFGIKDRITPAAMEKIARMVAICSSLAESREQLEKAGMKLDIKTVRTLAWDFGWEAIEAHLIQMEKWMKQAAESDAPLAGKRVVATIDGGRLRERVPTARGRKKKNGRRSFRAEWSEPRVLCIYLIDKEGGKIAEGGSCWYDATLSDADECFDVLKAHLKGLGVEHADEVVFVTDGAKWIWNRSDELWQSLGIQDKVTEIVDFYHAAERLHEISELRKSWSKKERERWFRKHRRFLREGQVEKVLEAIKELAVGRKSKEYLNKMGYFERHIERMRYSEFKEKKQPLGSGAVESAVRRIINQRLKGPGILWLHRSAQAMLLLRAFLKAGRWDELLQMTFANISQLQELP